MTIRLDYNLAENVFGKKTELVAQCPDFEAHGIYMSMNVGDLVFLADENTHVVGFGNGKAYYDDYECWCKAMMRN